MLFEALTSTAHVSFLVSTMKSTSAPCSVRNEETPILADTLCRDAQNRHLGIYGATSLGAHYRRIAYRIGKPKAITATARKLAVLVYRVLSGDLKYDDPGAQAYEESHRTRTLRNLRNRARLLGFGLVDLETGEALPRPVS